MSKINDFFGRGENGNHQHEPSKEAEDIGSFLEELKAEELQKYAKMTREELLDELADLKVRVITNHAMLVKAGETIFETKLNLERTMDTVNMLIAKESIPPIKNKN